MPPTRVRFVALLSLFLAGTLSAASFDRTIRVVEDRHLQLFGAVRYADGALILWSESPETASSPLGPELFVARIDGRGDLAEPPVRIASNASAAALASDGDATLVVWSEGAETSAQLRGIWIVSGLELGTPFTLSARSAKAIGAEARDGRFAIAWTEVPAGVHAALLEPGGRAFLSQQKLAGHTASYEPPTVAIGPDRILIAWEEVFDALPSPYWYARGTLFTRELTPVGAVSFDSERVVRSAVALPDGDFAAILADGASEFVARIGRAGTITRAYPLSIEYGSLMTSWRDQLALVWRHASQRVFLSLESAHLVRDGAAHVGFRPSTGDVAQYAVAPAANFVVVAFTTFDKRIGYAAIDPLDRAALPEQPAPARILRQEAGQESVEVLADVAIPPGASLLWIDATPLDDSRLRAQTFAGTGTPSAMRGLAGDTMYSIRVAAENERGFTSSPPAIFRTLPTPNPRPPLWTATVRNGDGSWTIRWRDMSSNEDSFRILASTATGNLVTVANAPANATEITLSGLSSYRFPMLIAAARSNALMWTGFGPPSDIVSRRRSAKP